MPRDSPARGASAARVVDALGAWFDRAARDLPWRRTRDPWAILLSEVMLQQTRVEAVVPHYHRMLARFPEPAVMAEAPLDDVLTSWAGLGYYRRARSLWLCAREIAARHGGALPDQVDALRALPGVGPYTAGAVASIAFDRRAALVDGNVARVLSRLFALDEPPTSAAGQRSLWQIAERLVPADRPGRFNQALMELGATVCTPTSPACAICPLERECRARREGRAAELPRRAPKRPPRAVRLVAAVLRDDDGRAVLCQRPAAGLLAGLWEPPMREGQTPQEVSRWLRAAGLLAPRARLVARGEVVHVLTHRELTVAVLGGRAAARLPAAPPSPYVALSRESAEPRALSTLARRVLAVGEVA